MSFKNKFDNLKEIDDFRLFEHTIVGDYVLSIQASKKHRCEPRELLPKLSDYNQVEVTFWEKDNFSRKINYDDSDFDELKSLGFHIDQCRKLNWEQVKKVYDELFILSKK